MNKPTKLFQLFVLLAIVAVLAVPSLNVAAGLRACRTDPIIFLSDGTKLTVKVSVAAERDAIGSIVYTVHLPEGVSIDKVVYTQKGWGLNESVIGVNDGGLSVDTVVAAAEGTAVSVEASIKGASATVEGVANSPVVVVLQ